MKTDLNKELVPAWWDEGRCPITGFIVKPKIRGFLAVRKEREGSKQNKNCFNQTI